VLERLYDGKFKDPAFLSRLDVEFAARYFDALRAWAGDGNSPRCPRVWATLFHRIPGPDCRPLPSACAGINAHINYDLPRAIGENLDPEELGDYRKLQLRKFDHDQVNNLLIRVLPQIQTTLATDYEPGIVVADALMGNLDELAGGEVLKVYRERVWWNALAFAAAKVDGKDGLVRDKLDWESAHLAKDLVKAKWLWSEERVLNIVVATFERHADWTAITLEQAQKPE
jgi:hypothetical protein